MTTKPVIRRARRLRRESNTPEQVAWSALRKLRAQGFPVRRQHPIGPYVVDFAIMRAWLVIEIDGSIHGRDEVQLRDQERENELCKLGWSVVRFSAEEAMHPDYLVSKVMERLGL